MRTLVPLSGGYDSTAVLHRLLTETDDAIHAYHLSHRIGRHHNRPETLAVKDIVRWLYRHDRPFTFSSSTFSTSLGCGSAPLVFVGLFSGVLANVLMEQERFDRIVIGSIGPQEAGSQANNDIGEALFEAITEHRMVPPRFDYPFQHDGSTKAGMIAAMPAELREMAWTCKHPVKVPGGWRPCGVCAKCTEREAAFKEAGL